MLRAESVKKFYGPYPALDGLDLEVRTGALFGFVGPNGAGKTTLLKILSGILYPDSGTVTLDDLDQYRDNALYKAKTGYVPDVLGNYGNLKVREYMEFFAACAGITGLSAEERITRLLQYVRLDDREDYFVDTLSRGMKQKLSLARALIHDPDVLILDEPTAGLDPRTRYEFRQLIGELSDGGKTVIISSHILSDISELCTDIGIIDQGSLLMSGSLMDVLRIVTESNPLVISFTGRLNAAVKYLRARSDVRSLTVKGQDIMINFAGDLRGEQELLKSLVDAGFPVRSFSREKSSLESIFMQLTGNGAEKTLLSYRYGEEDGE